MDKISVVVPVYKVEQYICKCVDSIINQTYKNLEIILVDDGSPDNCGEICDNYKKIDDRITVIHKKNGGLSDARNAGIKIATGKYITFIDSDDFAAPEMICMLYENIIKCNADIVMCGYYIFWGDDLNNLEIQNMFSNSVKYATSTKEKMNNLFYESGKEAWGKLYDINLFQKHLYPNGRLYEDFYLTPRLVFDADKTVCIPDRLYYYRIRENSIMTISSQIKKDLVLNAKDNMLYFESIASKKELKYIFPHLKDELNHGKCCADGKTETGRKYLAEYKSFISKYFLLNLFQIKHYYISYRILYFKSYAICKFKKLLKEIKSCFRDYKDYFKPKNVEYYSEVKEKLIKYNKNRIILLCSPVHSNLGDHAIAYAELEFFNNKYPNYEIIEIPGTLCGSLAMKKIIKYFKKKDVFCINGGGNMGSLWRHDSAPAFKALSRYKNNKIIIFPQTIYYSPNEFGENLIKKDRKLFSKFKKLYLCVRENNSYNFVLKNNFLKSENIVLVPDMVLYLNKLNIDTHKRLGALVCLREDIESNLNEIKKEKIFEKIRSINSNLKEISTIKKNQIKLKDRKYELYDIWNKFASAEFIVTDRLHAMIFAIITGTPCVALNNLSGKVQGVYKWIEQIEYVKFIDDLDLLEESIKAVISIKNPQYNAEILSSYYEIIYELFEK